MAKNQVQVPEHFLCVELSRAQMAKVVENLPCEGAYDEGESWDWDDEEFPIERPIVVGVTYLYGNVGCLAMTLSNLEDTWSQLDYGPHDSRSASYRAACARIERVLNGEDAVTRDGNWGVAS